MFAAESPARASWSFACTSLGIRESAILFLFSGYATPEKLLAGSLLITFIDGVLPILLGFFFIKPFLNGLWEDEKPNIRIVSNGV